MKDFSLFDKALKSNWVKRLCFNSDVPKKYLPKILANVGGTELFKCNYEYNLLELDNHLPAFFKKKKAFFTGRTPQQLHQKQKQGSFTAILE